MFRIFYKLISIKLRYYQILTLSSFIVEIFLHALLSPPETLRVFTRNRRSYCALSRQNTFAPSRNAFQRRRRLSDRTLTEAVASVLGTGSRPSL